MGQKACSPEFFLVLTKKGRKRGGQGGGGGGGGWAEGRDRCEGKKE